MKNKNAQALGSRGGKKAASNMTPAQRSRRAKNAVESRKIREEVIESIKKSLHFAGSIMMFPYKGTDGKNYQAVIHVHDFEAAIKFPKPTEYSSDPL